MVIHKQNHHIQLRRIVSILSVLILLLTPIGFYSIRKAAHANTGTQSFQAGALPFGDTGAAARFEVTPYGTIYASTWNDNSFSLTNTSTGGQRITAFTLDLRGAILPDLVFDPDGKAGDQYAKGLTPNDGTVAVGYSGHQLSGFHNGSDDSDGFDQLTITFTEFDPGEVFGFSIDIDPTSIKGATSTGPNEAGSVSGMELTGATVTLTFNDGNMETADLFHRAGSHSGGQNLIRAASPAQPTITLLGHASPSTLSTSTQTIQVTAPEGATVRLFQLEGGLFELLNGGYDVEPFEANTAVSYDEYGGTVGSGGMLDLTVAMTKTLAGAGLNHFVAAVTAPDGMTGAISNKLIFAYDPEGGSSTATPTATGSATPMLTPTATPTITADPTHTATQTPTLTNTTVPTPTPQLTSTPTLTSTLTATATATATGEATDRDRLFLPLIQR